MRLVSQPTGKWGIVNDFTVAVGDGHPYLNGPTNDVVVIKRGAAIYTKQDTDRCDACGSDLHLDHYSTVEGCRRNSAPSFGDYPVFHLKWWE